MKKWFVFVCVLICCGFTDNNILNNLNNKLPNATVGIIVQDAKSGKVIYEQNSNKHFLPASTTKLFTAAAALKYLGPNYQYETALYYQPKGDLSIKFNGDPSLTFGDLQRLLAALSQAQISKISGDLWIDDSIFEGPMYAPGWGSDDTPWYHGAPVSAIILDRNQFGVTLQPADIIGSQVIAKLDPKYPAAKFVKLQAKIRGVNLQDSEERCQIIAVVNEKNNAQLSGCWPVGNKPVALRMAIKNPKLYAKNLVLSELKRLHIKLHGQVKFAPMPTKLLKHKIAQHNSEPLYLLLNPVLGDSNNLYAESLAKTLGAKMFGVGSFKTGTLAMQQILGPLSGKLHDGSGASRYNLLSPTDLSNLLYSMHREPEIGPYFRSALSLSGVSGTLQQRFVDMDPGARIQAKTGSLNGVSALSGYVTTRNKNELIVTIMINQAINDSAELKRIEDEFCNTLVHAM